MAQRSTYEEDAEETTARQRDADERRALESLTATEREILKLVVSGRRNAEVAAALGLSPRTVETYRGRFMRKLRLNHLPALVKLALRHGLTTLD